MASASAEVVQSQSPGHIFFLILNAVQQFFPSSARPESFAWILGRPGGSNSALHFSRLFGCPVLCRVDGVNQFRPVDDGFQHIVAGDQILRSCQQHLRYELSLVHSDYQSFPAVRCLLIFLRALIALVTDICLQIVDLISKVESFWVRAVSRSMPHI